MPNVRTSLVTAASRGIGKAIAMKLAHEGVQVAICSSDDKAVESTVNELRAQTSVRVAGYCIDMADPVQVAALLENVSDALGPPDILVYNSPPPRHGRFGTLAESDWRRASETMLMTAVALVKGVLPHMQRQAWGRIIFMGSSLTNRPVADLCLSNAYRSALVGVARSLVTEVGAGVTVNTILPGNIMTDRVVSIFQQRARASGQTYEDFLAEQTALSPARRLGDAAEVADLVAFVASERAGFIHGSMISIDGGHSEIAARGM